MLLIICSGDIGSETNIGPKKNTKNFLLNLNGIAVDNFSKVSLLKAMATTILSTILYVCKKRFLILCLTRLMTELIYKDTIF